jgi:hypothetical protein
MFLGVCSIAYCGDNMLNVRNGRSNVQSDEMVIPNSINLNLLFMTGRPSLKVINMFTARY